MVRKGFRKKKKSSSKKKEESFEKIALELYSDEIKKIEILTKREEQILAQRKDDAKDKLKKFIRLGEKKRLNNKQENQFRESRKNYLEIRNELVEKNLRLVKYIANNFRNKYELTLEEYEDIIQYANEGSIEAANRFNINKGCKFSTFASWWIKQAIYKALTFPGLLRNEKHIPKYLMELKGKIPSYRKHFEEIYGKKPEKDEFIEYLHKMTHTGREILSSIVDLKMYNSSLYCKLKYDESSFLIDLIENKHSERPEKIIEEISKKEKTNQLDKYLSSLKEQERIVLKLRHFCLDNEVLKFCNKTKKQILDITLKRKSKKVMKDVLTFEEVGNLISKTKQRIDQIEKKALNKLRAYILFDSTFKQESLELKKKVLSFFPECESSLETLNYEETNKKMYEVITSISFNEKAEKSNGLSDEWKSSKNRLGQYLDLLPNPRNSDLMKLIYEIDDLPIKKKYNISPEEKISLERLALIFDLKKAGIGNLKEKCEEMMEYIDWGIKPKKNIYKTRELMIENYKELAENSIANIKDEVYRDILKLKYNLDREYLQKKYSINKHKLTNKEIGGLLEIPFAHVQWKLSRGFKELWNSMKLIHHAETSKVED